MDLLWQRRRLSFGMRQEPNLKTVSDDALLRRLFELVRQSRRVEADLVAHIAEVEARRLFAREAASSMFDYCRQVLHLRENEAYLRITVARASRELPVILTMLRDGRLHLSGIARLVPHLTRQNREAVLKRAAGMSHREIRELVRELDPKPDAPTTVRRLPDRAAGKDGGNTLQLGAPRVESPEMPLLAASPTRHATAPVRPAAVEPLAPSRYKIQFTASAALREKLERLQALMRSSVPDRDLAKIFDLLVTEKLERLEARRFAKTKSPRKSLSETDKAPKSRYIPAAVRRAVHDRDEGRCTYRDRHGRRWHQAP
ncbi:MAG: hypothetical protein PVJ73_04835 [Acidobacteriota bacterium]|jgi:hypothetical protein